VELNSTENPHIGAQGYSIRCAKGSITISGNASDGTTDGVYTLLCTLMIEHSKDPWPSASAEQLEFFTPDGGR
jgi:hypothetical protein